jgi:chromosome segregation ATPase
MKTTNENESLLNELTQLEADLSNQVKEAEQKLKSLRANHARISKLINLLNGLGNLINQDQNKVHVTEATCPGYSRNGKKLGRPSNERLANLKAQNANMQERFALSQKRDQLNKAIDSLDWIIDMQEAEEAMY